MAGQGRLDPGLFACFLDYGTFDRRTCRDAAAYQVVEHARVDRFSPRASRKPQLREAIRRTVHVRRVGVNAEIAGRCTLEIEARHRAKACRHGVTFVPPAGKRPFLRERRRHLGHRRAPSFDVGESRNELNAVAFDVEHVAEPRQSLGARGIETAHCIAVDDEREVDRCRWRDQRRQPFSNRG